MSTVEFEDNFHKIGGVETEVLSLSSSADSDSAIVMIPGNPGVAGFYRPFLQSIFGGLGAKHSIFCVGFAGHSQRAGTWKSKIYTLDEQIDHKIAFLESVLDTTNTKKLVLVSHSVGSYICMQIVKRRPDLPITRVIQIYPCIFDFPKHAGFLINTIMKPGFRQALSFFAAGLGMLPEFVKRRIAHFATHGDEAHLPTALSLFRYDMAANVIGLSFYEHQAIREMDTVAIKSMDSKTYWICGENDQWGPPRMYPLLQAICSPDKVIYAPEMMHAFVLKGSEQMAKLVTPLIAEACV